MVTKTTRELEDIYAIINNMIMEKLKNGETPMETNLEEFRSGKKLCP